VLFITGTRAIADGAAGSNQANLEFNLLSKLLRLARPCIENSLVRK